MNSPWNLLERSRNSPVALVLEKEMLEENINKNNKACLYLFICCISAKLLSYDWEIIKYISHQNRYLRMCCFITHQMVMTPYPSKYRKEGPCYCTYFKLFMLTLGIDNLDGSESERYKDRDLKITYPHLLPASQYLIHRKQCF